MFKPKLRSFEGNYSRVEQRDYEIFPKIVRSGQSTAIRIRPLGRHSAFDAQADYTVYFMPMDQSIEPRKYNEYPSLSVKPQEGSLCFEHVFAGEQEHLIKVYQQPHTAQSGPAVGVFHVYSLFDDLYARRPYRGDFHVHTCESDGSEEPAIVAAKYREYGFDFLAITDHHKWYPSDDAMKACQGVATDLKVFHGEEVHAPGNHIHIVNFGGNASVNECFENDRETYHAQVREIERKNSVPEGVDAFEYASSVWVFDKIRELGGLGIFAHPYWIANVYHVAQNMVDHLFETMPFDAFEVLGGHEESPNNMQTAYYNEMRAQGKKVPIVGSSDSHNDDAYFNWFTTIVFAQSLEAEAVTAAVKGLYSVAVEQYPGEAFRVYGPLRMVKYAIFLLEEYFPLHARLCFEEGRLLKDHFSGDEEAAAILGRLRGRTERFREKCFSVL